ncbi:MAG: peptidase [Gemmatimonadetes bacterium]|nr:peptidase [Gemmatimonadota bacterium]
MTPPAQPAVPRPRTSDPTVRPKHVPVEARPWRILFVPPTPGAQTRALSLTRWQRRTVIGGLIALVAVAAAGVATIVVGMNSEDIFAPSADLAAIRGRLAAVEDSLSQARSALATSEDLLRGPRSIRDLPLDVRQRLLYGATPSMAGLSSDGLPVNGTITSGFSTARRHPLLNITRAHLGVDITAPRGSRISAPSAGRVSFVGWKFALGLLVEIQHPNGVVTRYAHCRMALVRAGDRVSRGTMIATVGSSGLTTGPHLHYEVWRNGNAIDPLRFRFPVPVDSVATPGG